MWGPMCTAVMMSLLVMKAKGPWGCILYAQIGVCGCAPAHRRARMQLVMALTGQQGIAMAWCKMICPHHPFFKLKIHRHTKSGSSGLISNWLNVIGHWLQ